MTLLAVDRVFGHPGADAIEIDDGRITAIGRVSEFAAPGSMTTIGGVVLPGLRDSHIHPLEVASAGTRLDLGWVRSFDDLSSAIRRRAGELRPEEPLIATGLDDERLAEGRMPNRRELDEILCARPILVYRHCSHIASANTLALSLAGLDMEPVDPVGGRVRRARDGTADGVLEEAAIGSVSRVLAIDLAPPDTESVLATLADLRSKGVVAIDAMVSAGPSMWCSGGDEVASLLALDEPPVRIDVHVIATTPEELTEAARRLADAPDGIRFAGWKGFADGSLGGRTAALRDDYTDASGQRGLRRTPVAELRALAEHASSLGGSSAIHAIGDAAVDMALSIAATLDRGSVRIEHASVADPDQVSRMAETGTTASIQPSFVTSDAEWLGDRLGPDRIAWAYPFRSMVDAGVRILGGSDGPIEETDPMVGIADAIRERPESVSLDEAIRLYANDHVAVGRPADLVVFDRLPDTGDPLPSVAAMWMDGRRVR